jgi:hypothetical protein
MDGNSYEVIFLDRDYDGRFFTSWGVDDKTAPSYLNIPKSANPEDLVVASSRGRVENGLTYGSVARPTLIHLMNHSKGKIRELAEQTWVNWRETARAELISGKHHQSKSHGTRHEGYELMKRLGFEKGQLPTWPVHNFVEEIDGGLYTAQISVLAKDYFNPKEKSMCPGDDCEGDGERYAYKQSVANRFESALSKILKNSAIMRLAIARAPVHFVVSQSKSDQLAMQGAIEPGSTHDDPGPDGQNIITMWRDGMFYIIFPEPVLYRDRFESVLVHELKHVVIPETGIRFANIATNMASLFMYYNDRPDDAHSVTTMAHDDAYILKEYAKYFKKHPEECPSIYGANDAGELDAESGTAFIMGQMNLARSTQDVFDPNGWEDFMRSYKGRRLFLMYGYYDYLIKHHVLPVIHSEADHDKKHDKQIWAAHAFEHDTEAYVDDLLVASDEKIDLDNLETIYSQIYTEMAN